MVQVGSPAMMDEHSRKKASDQQGLANLSLNTSRRPAGSPQGGPPEGSETEEGAAGTPGGEPLEDQQIPKE